MTIAWLAPRDSEAARCRDRPPKSWDIEVAARSEPGERLVVSGHVLSREHRVPLAGVSVYVYHADAKGSYNREDTEGGEPRLCGVLRTNSKGEYRIRTVMPGGYSPHLHFEVWGPSVTSQPLLLNLHRKGVVPVPDTARVPQLTLRDDLSATERRVQPGEHGVLECTRDLVVDTK